MKRETETVMNDLGSPTGGEGKTEMGVTLEVDGVKIYQHLLVGEAAVPVDGILMEL